MIKIDVQNIKGVTALFNKYGVKAVKEIGKVTKITAQEIESTAKTLAPRDNGTLAQSIRAEQQETPLDWKITAYMPYSAYHEFGTGGLVTIKEDWHDMAAQFRGKGIKEVNLPARPFMYPAFVMGRKNYNKELKEELKVLAKRFNNG